MTNLKTKNKQSCHNIKLYGSLTTKELKKKHSSRLGGGLETGSQGREDTWKVWQTRVGEAAGRSHMCLQISSINQEEQLGTKTNHAPQGSSTGK